MKNKRHMHIVCREKDDVIEIAVKRITHQTQEEFEDFFTFLREESKGKKIYISMQGSGTDVFNPEFVECTATDLNYRFWNRFHLKELSGRSVYKTIMNNRVVMIYIFEEFVDWESFLCTVDKPMYGLFDLNKLHGCVILGQAVGMMSVIKKEEGNSICAKIEKFAEKGYGVKWYDKNSKA